MTFHIKKQLLVLAAFSIIMTKMAYSETISSHTGEAKVSGFAQSFLSTAPIEDGQVRVIETGAVYKTNAKGEFGPIWHPIGKALTLVFAKEGYKTTQSATIIVPQRGLTDKHHQISFQVPSNITFRVFAYAIGADIHDDSCHVATTITAKHKTLFDIPQGEEGAVVTLTPKVNEKPFYFGMFKFKPIYGKTNPLSKDLTAASEDGGVAFVNLPPSKTPYVISAKKPGLKFTSAQFMCRKGAFINISPPQGPTVVG